MFCFQCEQTAHGSGCTEIGVCGKDPKTAALQDLLVYVVKGLSMAAHRARELGVKDRELDVFAIEALFATVTNVNFDAERIRQLIMKAGTMRDKARILYEEACQKAGRAPEPLNGPAAWKTESDMETLYQQGVGASIDKRWSKLGKDIVGLQELLMYGMKGMAAYADHALILGKEDDSVYAFIHEGLNFLTKENPTIDELFAIVMKCGEVNLKVLELLDAANTGAYGNPVPTVVRMTPLKGKAIAVSGHDLKDLEELLKQTEGKGIHIYTHGEMLPAHGYPHLKKYPHLVGHYGGAWMRQKKEFDEFPGAILMTTNCIQEPKPTYKNRIFTCGLVGWPGVVHIQNRDFTPVIEAALQAEGFSQDEAEKTTMVGFGHNAVLGVADKVIDAVKQGAIKHFFLIGGCDGAEVGRNYYTEMAETIPQDCVILTLGCGKFRVLDSDAAGDIGGIPRVLDMGQCNDSYSAIKVALALAEAFNTDVNSLPLSLIISWYEQKAVCVLLTLLYLGVKDIRLGPKLPAFVTPDVLKVLVEKFNIMPIGAVKDDLQAMLGERAA
ncbi:MAG: hydroxylamine reductase [Candidatus Omnitrophota bacterium]|jgi:hydroxylamine reductase|nr:MAG: hydroxylamine reductase [Candidatus Omnitrophota bacterium]